MQARVKSFLEDLATFSETQPNSRNNPNNKTYNQNISWSFYYATDLNFAKSMEYVERAPVQKKENTLRVAVLVGESYFLSFLPELFKQVDGVIIVDIDDKVLKNCRFLHRLMAECANSEDFAKKHIGENIIVKENWPVSIFNPQKREHTTIAPNSKITTQQLLVSNQFLGKKHFIEDELRYFQCRESLKKMFFSFVKLDLLNSTAVKQFQAILQKNQAAISILNLTNLLDYDGDFPLREWINNKDKKWKPSGKLYENLGTLCSQDSEVIILYSRLNKETGYQSLTACQASSVNQYMQQAKSYIEEMKMCVQVPQEMKYKGEYGRIFSETAAKPLPKDIKDIYRDWRRKTSLLAKG